MTKFPARRLRRYRQAKWTRDLVAESTLSCSDLIQPFFLIDGIGNEEKINVMPGINRYSLDKLFFQLDKVEELKIPVVAIFPCLNDSVKNEIGTEAINENGLICNSIREIKKRFPDLGVMADVALDPYTAHGHDGILNSSGQIMNDETVETLVKQARIQAEAGADIIAPSDMMDGRIGEIRKELESIGKKNTLIMSYAAKYSSAFYGPFRNAVSSKLSKGASKSTYQMDFRNTNEAILEAGLDVEEGADILLVKPGLPYLDIVFRLKTEFKLPTFAYQVSGEFAMIKAAAERGMIDETNSILESLMCFKRAGCDGIISYFSIDVANELKKMGIER